MSLNIRRTGENTIGDLMDDMKLRPAPAIDGTSLIEDGAMSVNRRQFMRHGFNAVGGVLAATLGALGFASILLPPSGGGGGDASVRIGPRVVKMKHGMGQNTSNQ